MSLRGEAKVAIKCNLCGSDDYKVISEIGYPFNIPVRNVICRKCGIVYQNPIPDYEKLKKYYYDYRQQTIEIAEPDEKYETYAKNMSRYHYSFFMEYCKPGMNILDVGCGAGTLMSWAVKDGLNAYGVNPDPGFGNYGPKHYGLKKVDICMYEDSTFDNEMFDIITFNHVFEHFSDATSMLMKTRKLLKKNGLIYLSIPNIKTPHGQLEYNFYYEHINTFSPCTIKCLLRKNGFKIIKLSKYGCETNNGLFEPYLDIVARMEEVDVPQPINWNELEEKWVDVDTFLSDYRRGFERDTGRLKIKLGLIRTAMYNSVKSNLFLKFAFKPVKSVLGRIGYQQPNYDTGTCITEFPREQCEHYE